MTKAIVQINAGNFEPITLIDMDDPSNSGDLIDGNLTKEQYLDVARKQLNLDIANKAEQIASSLCTKLPLKRKNRLAPPFSFSISSAKTGWDSDSSGRQLSK